jgi:hypothetical protein
VVELKSFCPQTSVFGFRGDFFSLTSREEALSSVDCREDVTSPSAAQYYFKRM